jgi:hypothetical protein
MMLVYLMWLSNSLFCCILQCCYTMIQFTYILLDYIGQFLATKVKVEHGLGVIYDDGKVNLLISLQAFRRKEFADSLLLYLEEGCH